MHLFLFTNFAQRELVSIYVHKVYATAINFPCIITLGNPRIFIEAPLPPPEFYERPPYFQGRPQILIGAFVVLLETPQMFIGDPQFFIGDLQNFIWVYTVKRCGSPTKI